MHDFFDTASIKDSYDLVIIGGGPAGCTAALYASRDELSSLVLEKNGPGGQIGITAYVDNHPAFPETISGMELSEKYYLHATKFGADFRNGECVDFRANGLEKEIYIADRAKPVIAKTVIIATGSSPKKLDIPGESKYFGHGVSVCATCDGNFYKGKIVAAVGGGNAALEESDYLTRFADKVYLIHRRDEFRGTKLAQKLVKQNRKIEPVLNSVVVSINGAGSVSSVDVRNLLTAENKRIDVDGVFVFIGQKPEVSPFDNLISVDSEGFLIADESTVTNIPGVFAAGDVRAKEIRQIVTAISDGAVAAKMAGRYIQKYSTEG
ncbi:MAG: thioredoxin-disulfide reductase [Deferribacteraceae bacterium]|jgi:thioredoxin reductase (NADPH)|nr:thioredoxin-disulfide reductase [Deferribacteraceae bacterium]